MYNLMYITNRNICTEKLDVIQRPVLNRINKGALASFKICKHGRVKAANIEYQFLN